MSSRVVDASKINPNNLLNKDDLNTWIQLKEAPFTVHRTEAFNRTYDNITYDEDGCIRQLGKVVVNHVRIFWQEKYCLDRQCTFLIWKHFPKIIDRIDFNMQDTLGRKFSRITWLPSVLSKEEWEKVNDDVVHYFNVESTCGTPDEPAKIIMKREEKFDDSFLDLAVTDEERIMWEKSLLPDEDSYNSMI